MSTASLLYDVGEQPGCESPPLLTPRSSHSESPPLLTPRSSHSVLCNSADSSGVCAACSHRRQRSRVVWAMFCVWAVPLALAGGRWYGLIGPGHHHGLKKDPHGSLLLAQVGRDSSPAAGTALRLRQKASLSADSSSAELCACVTAGLSAPHAA